MLIVAAAILAALVVLSFLYRLSRSRRFPLFGESMSFPLIFGLRPVVHLQTMLEKAAAYCNAVVEKSLRYPPQVTGDVWHGVNVIARNIMLWVSIIIIAGDLYNTLQSLPLLFGGAGGVDLGVSFAIPSSLLFVCMAALYGQIAFLECTKTTPYGTHLLPSMSDKVRKWLGIACAVGFALSVIFAVLFGVVRGYYTSIDPSTPAWLAIPALAIAGLVITGASVLALYGIVIGLTGVISLLFWLLSCGFQMLAGIVSIVVSPIEVYVQHNTQGRKSLYEELLGHEPYKAPASPFPESSQLSPGQQDTVALPEHAASDVAENEVQPMNDDRVICATFYGLFGDALLPFLKQEVFSRPVKRLFRSTGRINPLHPNVSKIGIGADVSPKQLRAGLDQAFEEMGNKIVGVHSPVNGTPTIFVHAYDWREGQKAFQLFQDIPRRLTNVINLLVTQISLADLRRPAVQAFLKGLSLLGVKTLIVGNDSELALRLGVVKFHEYTAHALVDLIECQLYSGNIPGVAICNQLGNIADFFTIAMDSASVDSGSVPRRGKLLSRFTNGKSVSGNVDDCLSQAFEITTHVMESHEYRAFRKPVSRDEDCYLFYDIPFGESRFHQIEQLNNQQVRAVYRCSHTIHLSGSPVTPLHGSPTPFRVGVTALFPVFLPELEPPVEKEAQDEQNTASAHLSADAITCDLPVGTFDNPASMDGNNPPLVRRRSRLQKAQ